MQTPPPLAPNVLIGGKVAVGLGWLFGLYATACTAADPSLHSAGFWTLVFLGGSHLLELAIYSPFLKACKATPADYLQVFLFGLFHSSGLKPAQ